MTDTHAHLYKNEFEHDLDQVVARAKSSGVQRVLLPNINVESIPSMLRLCNTHKDYFFPMYGLHPCEVKQDFEIELENIHRYLESNDAIAIGEIGIDLYWDKSTLPMQIAAFETQIEWAKLRGLPIAIHSREANHEVLRILKKHQDGLRGVMHCFSGSLEEAQAFVKLGFYLGIGGVVTYKNAHLPQIISQVGLEHLLLETDSPYLTPVPHRGKRNEPGNIPIIARKISEAYNVPYEVVVRQTESNVQSLFFPSPN